MEVVARCCALQLSSSIPAATVLHDSRRDRGCVPKMGNVSYEAVEREGNNGESLFSRLRYSGMRAHVFRVKSRAQFSREMRSVRFVGHLHTVIG